MGDDDDAPTAYAPTELAALTYPSEAWSLVEDEPEPRRLSPARITALAVVGCLAAVAAAGVVAYVHSRPTLGTVTMVTPEYEPTTSVAAVGESGFEIPPPPPPTTVTQVVAAPPREARSVDNPDFTVSQMAEFDRQFLVNIQNAGWWVSDPALITLRAHQMCVEYGMGTSSAGVYQKLLGMGNTPEEATVFMRVVTSTYPDCP